MKFRNILVVVLSLIVTTFSVFADEAVTVSGAPVVTANQWEVSGNANAGFVHNTYRAGSSDNSFTVGGTIDYFLSPTIELGLKTSFLTYSSSGISINSISF